MSKNIMTLEQYTEKFENLLMEKFGITKGDCIDDAQIEVEFITGSTPQDLVDWIGEKYDLTPKSDYC